MRLPTTANVVILASNYNPSIVSREWLHRKGVFTETVKNFVFTPVFSLVENEQCSLTVDEARLQYTVKTVTQENLALLELIPRRFVEALPETPYKALGFNYIYVVPEEKCNLESLLSPKRRRLAQLLSPSYQLGITAVFEFHQFIVHLTISPSFGKAKQTGISLNFHADVQQTSDIVSRLALHAETVKKAESVVQGVCTNG
ncbi:MAG: hypothetical protein FJ012_04690 [Chloroflexi bacterium]|nr:hypothetical protein [Chloroflexota bacterium]